MSRIATIVLSMAILYPMLGKAREECALAKVCFRVVDQDGVIISDAKIWGGFTAGNFKTDYTLVNGATNTNGEYVAQGKCNEFLRVDVTKEGYYHTEVKIFFNQSKARPIVANGKWQPYGEMRTVVLKKIKNPVRVSASEGLIYYKYPPQGKWTGFDLCRRDWVYPDGSGEFPDVSIRIDREATSEGYVKTMEVAFTNNPFAGAYEMPVDAYSDLRSSYEANTNASFSGVLKYVFKRGKNGNERTELAKGKYLVFRTRTNVDVKGNLASAHYGMIFGNWRFCEKGGMAIEKIVFNPIPNDPNLEDAETARRSSQMWGTASGVTQAEPFWTSSGFASLLSVGKAWVRE